MDVEMQTQQTAMQAGWSDLIEQRLARLARRHPRLIRVHVTLKHGGHHRGGAEEVDVLASCPGATLRAAKREPRMQDAVHAALDAIERELAAHRAGRRAFCRRARRG
jgi:ribosomal subunit interface protein